MDNLLNKWFLDGVDLYEGFKLILQEGKAGLLQLPQRKESLSNNWPDENGTEIDLSNPRFEDASVTLKMAFLCASDTEFHQKRTAFWQAISSPGSHTLTIADHSADYLFYYVNSTNFKIGSTRLKDVEFVYVPFDLTLVIQNEEGVNIGNGEPVYIKTSSGSVLAVQPPGSTYIVPEVEEISGGSLERGDEQYQVGIGLIKGEAL